MDIKSIILVLVAVFGVTSKTVTADGETKCLDASYCKLIMGDVARESDKYGKDPTKFYREAEEGVTLFKQYSQSPNNAIKEECDRIESACLTEVAKMAVEALKFPSKYESTCDYKSYSRTIFDCKNIKSWPQTVKEVLTKPSKTCRTECVIVEDSNITLSTGKVVNEFLAGVTPPPAGDPEIDAMESEEKKINTGRKIVATLSAFEDGPVKPTWSPLDICPEQSWVVAVDKITKGDYLFHIGLGCTDIVKGKPSPTGPQYKEQLSGVENIAKRPETSLGYWNLTLYSKVWAQPQCDTSFLTGLSFNKKQYKTFGEIPLYVNFICAKSTGWTYPRENRSLPSAKPDSKELVCPVGTAICAVQTGFTVFEGISFMIAARFGCCEGDKNNIDLYQKSTPPPPTTTSGGGAEELLNLQKRSGNYFLFWDESEVLNDIITRYNIYYSPATLKDEDVFIETKCPEGQYLGSYELDDPKSCYFQGRRIPRIVFNCTDKAGKKGDKLDIYGRLKDGHTLQDSKYFQSKDCTGGYYTGIEFTYYVDKEYPYLVNAWGLKMKCSSGGTTTDHESVIKAYENLDLAAHKTEKASVDCGAGKAVCGFQNKVADNHSGVFEGLYFKIVCCTV